MKKLLNSSLIYYFIATICLVALIAPIPSPPDPGIDKRLKVYVDRFEYIGKYIYNDSSYEIPKMTIAIHTINDFNLGIIAPDAIGICHYFKIPRTILISEKHWNEASNIQREMLVFHELGHCALGRLHKTSTNPWGEEMSLMYPKIFSPQTYKENYEYFIHELFSPY